MLFASAYLIRQVADKSGGTGPDPDATANKWKRAKNTGNLRELTDDLYIHESPQVFVDHYIDNGVVQRHELWKKKTVGTGVSLYTPDEPWLAYRYLVQKQIAGGFPATVGSVWYSEEVVAVLQFSATLEGGADDWIDVNDTYDIEDVTGVCMRHIADDYEWIFEASIPKNSFFAHHEIITTNVPHFETQADGEEYQTKARGYISGSVTEEEFRNFLRTKMVNP